jgi:ABC-type branched-subunit amino acid transport system ATPase component
MAQGEAGRPGGGVPSSGPPLLELDGVTKAFGGVRAVDGVDLALGAGELRCIIGPNGCGKTTLFNLVTGYLAPTAGDIRFAGRSIVGEPPDRLARAGIVRKFQVPSVFPALSVADNLRVARSAVRPTRPSGAERIDILAAVGLDEALRRPAGSLSHGQTQWLELALVVETQPTLVLLDEPAAGMTRVEKAKTLELIAAIRHRTGAAVLVIEHDMAFVAGLDCPVSVMVLGRIVATGAFDHVRRDDVVRRAYLGTAHG